MPEIAPYGAWRSPITADLIVSASIALFAPAFGGNDLYWLESRPTEGGRYVIVRRRPDGSTEDVNAAPLNARTRVHEYGGGDYVVAEDGTVYFSNFADQRLYVARPGAEPAPLSHTDGMRYADAVLDAARNRLISVREDHSAPDSEAVNTIAAVDLTSGDETVLVDGHDFFASPRLSPDGTSLCWLAWDHPNMPWDGTELRIARFDASGALEASELVAGGPQESIFQPEWSPDGRLCFVSDRSGWWQLYRRAHSGRAETAVAPLSVEPVVRGADTSQAEFGQPLWQFGASTYAFDGPGRIVAAYCVAGSWRLASIDTATGALSDIAMPYTHIRELTVRDGRAVFFGAAPDAPAGLVSLDIATGAHELLKRSSTIDIDPGSVSRPETIEFPTVFDGKGGVTAFGFFYPPRNADYAAPPGTLPPLVVMSHGGPTSATAAVLSARIQYWTTRGIAVLDVNYGGSTGYGRAYRERLNGRWGIVDVDDCCAGARYLVERGLVDGNRLAITGGSAGGYTTLAALAFRDVFHAGASHYGVSDLEALATDTHKFESRYLDGLVGPYNPASARAEALEGRESDPYYARSPIHHVDGLNCPVIFFQGLEDRIVPPNQAETMVDALRAKGVPVAYLPFEGEQHGFRRAENIKRSLEAELFFYGRIFGFEPADEIEAVEIVGL